MPLRKKLPSPKMKRMSDSDDMLTLGGHLEVVRRMLIRALTVVCVIAIAIFCFKEQTWRLLLAPGQYDFVTYRWIEWALHQMGYIDFGFEPYHVSLIATDLSSQFMQHLSTSLYLGVLCASPYLVWELFRFVSPALYDNEKRYSVVIATSILVLFVIGVLMSYFVLFPIAFRFLGTYSVSDSVVSHITLDSYVSTFVTLTLVMGLVFQLPVVAFVLGKMGLVRHDVLARYRKHAFLLIMIVAAIITPPDVMTLVLVTVPLYLLYISSIQIVRKVEPQIL